MSIKQTLTKIFDLVPESCKGNRQYVYARDFIEHREWKLAFESFLELADETEGIFPKEYWELLTLAGHEMKIENIADQVRIYINS